MEVKIVAKLIGVRNHTPVITEAAVFEDPKDPRANEGRWAWKNLKDDESLATHTATFYPRKKELAKP